MGQVLFSMNMIYTRKKIKHLRKANYIQCNLDDKRSRHEKYETTTSCCYCNDVKIHVVK